MGLFKRSGGEAAPKESGRRFGTAAFDPADTEDARRGHPAVSLQQFAGSVGLAYRNSDQLGAFLSTLPTWPDYLFNVCAGAMPSGRYGMVAHELLQVDTHNGSISAGGSYYDVRMPLKWHGLEIGGISVKEPPNEPFAAEAVWIPTTTAHVRVPETNVLPLLRITKSNSFSIVGNNGLDHLGLPGYRVRRGDDNPQLLATIAQALAPFLNARPDAHVDLHVRYGLVALTVNGYRANPDDLRHLIWCADGIAGALIGLTPAPSGLPFDAPGPAAGTIPRPIGIPLPHPIMVPAYAQVAAHWGMHNEDGAHLMMLFPGCPIPGTPSGVLAGRFPGSGTPCRIVWYEQGGRTSGSVRGGVLLPARPGVTTPLGGQLVQQAGMYVEVVDGIAALWRQQRSIGQLEPDQLLSLATAALQATGVA